MRLSFDSIPELKAVAALLPDPEPPAPVIPENVYINPAWLERVNWESQEVVHVIYSNQVDTAYRTLLSLTIGDRVIYSVPLILIPPTGRVNATPGEDVTIEFLNPENAKEPE